MSNYTEYLGWLIEWASLRRALARKIAASILAEIWEEKGLDLEEGKQTLSKFLQPSFLTGVRETVEDILVELEAIASNFENAHGREPNPAELAYGAKLGAKEALDEETIKHVDDLPF